MATLSSVGTQRHDELRDATGAIRAHWQPIIAGLLPGGSEDYLRQSLELTRRLIVENGITYNVYADPQGAGRPWPLDPVPLPIAAGEWQHIEAGVEQRARVLDALLADLYGPQRLLAEGLVPAELAFGHPNFVWPVMGMQPPGGRWLHLYAADLARAPDGRWWVLADRTQAPSGAGYALENRDILEQVHPELMRDCGVRRLGSYFNALHAVLQQGGDGQSLAVVLTPGPYNETYFEHAYLARQLGVPLVEGHDLTVRSATVYLKSLGGLRRVHAILRRLDDDYCDPLELRWDSALGVPGLLQAVRAGNVMVTNAVGSGVLESAGWLGFLPAVAERLLGEKLLLPEVATWWCGEKPALEYVLANIDRLVIKPAYPNQRFEPMFGHQFQGEERARLFERLRARPYAYIAQEHVALSQAPVFQPNGSREGLSPRALIVRVHAVATADGVRVLPGGLARVAPAGATDVVSTQRGGASKDVWVLSGAASARAAGTGRQINRVRRKGRLQVIPSRLVENMYWLGRYTVRCENKARILRRTIAARVDQSLWQHALAMCQMTRAIPLGLDPAFALRADHSPDALTADIRRLAESASQARNCLSARHWRTVVALQRQLQDGDGTRGNSYQPLERLLLSLAALTGFAEEDMTHDDAWRLMRIGRRMERLQFIANLLANHLLSSECLGSAAIEWLLGVCDNRSIYRARYRDVPRLSSMLDLLVCDSHHPLALAFLIRTTNEDLERVVQSLGMQADSLQTPALPEERDLDLLEDSEAEGQAARQSLAGNLFAVTQASVELADRLSRRHFSHVDFDAQSLAV